MENGLAERWGFRGSELVNKASAISIRSVLNEVMQNMDEEDLRPTIPLGHGDPSAFPSFRTTPIAEDAVSDALHSAKFNGYAPTVGILPARRYTYL
ncbi:hypothetical protein HYC85_014248 [Camellia sinensis]|uniref:Aminotransferase class I/classII domain-containing protein n=1 Tax=Camellia sinensis TaxID=4442 RepID=A0A7J7H7S8_CAMSI|nr:hypothetical protein HYC85_014248 [Camellia sinensis]